MPLTIAIPRENAHSLVWQGIHGCAKANLRIATIDALKVAG
ncbi:hypothetical protein BN2475_270032 [Paraburkholderia ribeironis]|uniref:Uncharacterized protein n=1 Tax=Paraburkholderia ribeironis TaxID=1247936 RepID=A0A1N7RZZ5_9BURK|nr:hypothetical protein BN2475_270032 [Paraburkholderia ribeironis]